MTFLVILLVGLGFLVILPLMLLKLVLGLILLPFKLLGLVFRVVFGILGLVFGLLFSGVGLVLALLVAVGVALLVPLLPIVLIGVGIWLLVRSSGPRTPLRLSA